MKTVMDAVNEFNLNRCEMDMNKHILFVMGDLANPSKYTQKELEDNRTDAYASASASAADYAASAASAYAASAASASAEKWVDKYFERTGEDKQVYIDALKPKRTQPVFTQAMADNGERPKVGMRCLIRFTEISDDWHEYTIDFMGKYKLIASGKDTPDQYGHAEHVALVANTIFKPIDTRTEEDILVDEAMDFVMESNYKNNNQDVVRDLIKAGYRKVGE